MPNKLRVCQIRRAFIFGRTAARKVWETYGKMTFAKSGWWWFYFSLDFCNYLKLVLLQNVLFCTRFVAFELWQLWHWLILLASLNTFSFHWQIFQKNPKFFSQNLSLEQHVNLSKSKFIAVNAQSDTRTLQWIIDSNTTYRSVRACSPYLSCKS